MAHYEYKVIPAPAKGKRAKGVRSHEARFAFALQELMNQMGADGWEYQRAETLPSEERHGLTSVTTTYRNVLVFRRPLSGTLEGFKPRLLAPPNRTETAPKPSDADDDPDSFFADTNKPGLNGTPLEDDPATVLLRARAQQQKADRA